MSKKTILTFLFVMSLILAMTGQIVEATTLHGTVYDLELNKVENALVEIDTEPAQRYLAKDGSYSFEVPKGDYTIRVTYSIDDLNDTYREDLAVSQEGNYVFDIFLFPEIYEEEELLTDTEDFSVYEDDTNGTETNLVLWGGVMVILLLIFLFLIKEYFRFKRKDRYKDVERQLESDYEKIVMELLQKNDGRATQN